MIYINDGHGGGNNGGSTPLSAQYEELENQIQEKI